MTPFQCIPCKEEGEGEFSDENLTHKKEKDHYD